MDVLGNKSDENEEIDLLVCVPCGGSSRPVYGSLRAACYECKTPVWVSVSGQKALRERAALRPFCMNCAKLRVENSDEKPTAEIVPGAIDEIRRHLLRISEN